MSLEFHFPQDCLAQWLDDGVPLPEGLELKAFGLDHGDQGAVSDTALFREYCSQKKFGLIQGEDFWVSFGRKDQGLARLQFVVNEESPEAERPLLARARDVFEALLPYTPAYAFSCAAAELEHRNLFERDAHRMMVGQDAQNRIPGLYWLNYFSLEYLEEHPFDIERISSFLRAQLERREDGYFLQLYDEPSQWEAAAGDTDIVLQAEDAFFSMTHVKPPEHMSFVELTQFLHEVNQEWP